MFSSQNSQVSNGSLNYIEDVFSTYLYTGTGTGQTINNGIALVANYGGSAKFDGTGDYLTVASNAAFGYGTGNFTFEAWINPSVAHSGYVLDHGTTGNTGTIELAPDGKIIYYNSTSGAIQTAPGYAPFGSWTHVAVVRSSGTTTIYINGTSRASGVDSHNYSDQRVVIGAISSNFLYAFNGYISNLRIVKGTAVYTAAFTPPTAPLTSISGTSLLTGQAPTPLIDNSANAFPITVVNATADVSYGPFIDTANSKGGLVWFKNRSVADDNVLFNTVSGPTKMQRLLTDAQETIGQSIFRTFNSNGFTHGGWGGVGGNGNAIASWTFREQPKFFDIVTYTGTGGGPSSVAHALGSVPGCVIIKSTSRTGNWVTVSRMSTGNYAAFVGSSSGLQSTAAADSTTYNLVGAGAVTSTTFDPSWWNANGTVGAVNNICDNGVTYVAYLFAHDAGGFGLTGTDNVISCGSFTTNGSGAATVTLNYEPQLVLLKPSSAVGDWEIYDTMRGMPNSTDSALKLNPNLSSAESNGKTIFPTATGFEAGTKGTIFAASTTYIYIAIRRGPMKTPTTGTSVFSPQLQTPTGGSYVMAGSSGFPVDWLPTKKTGTVGDWFATGRLTNNYLSPNTTAAEGVFTYGFDRMAGVSATWDAAATASYAFRRAPGFFDVVCYTGTGSATTFNHNLNVIPELMIMKERSSPAGWWWNVYYGTANKFLKLNTTEAETTNTAVWNNTAPTSSVFSIGAYTPINTSGSTYVAYLFASAAGVSKVGSYTGNGTSLTIPCGFTAGARFVMIKCTSTTGDWYVWDTARGIVSGNDPHLSLNTAAAEVTTDDTIDPDNSGFIVNQVAATNVNVSSATYIFLAIA